MSLFCWLCSNVDEAYNKGVYNTRSESMCESYIFDVLLAREHKDKYKELNSISAGAMNLIADEYGYRRPYFEHDFLFICELKNSSGDHYNVFFISTNSHDVSLEMIILENKNTESGYVASVAYSNSIGYYEHSYSKIIDGTLIQFIKHVATDLDIEDSVEDEYSIHRKIDMNKLHKYDY